MCDPKMVLDLISLGIDMFDTSYAYHTASNGEALTFLNSFESPIRNPNENCPSSGGDDEKSPTPRTGQYVISMKDERFKDDFKPLVNACDCYTCRCHTR